MTRRSASCEAFCAGPRTSGSAAPKRVLPRLRALAKDLQGSSLAADVARRLATLEKSPELKQAVKVDEAFGRIARGLEKRRSCTQCRLDAILKVRIDCRDCRAENRGGFEKAEKQLRALIKANPGLSVTRRVEAYLKSLAPAGDSP